MSVVTIERKVLEKNDALAAQNRCGSAIAACSCSTWSALLAPARPASSSRPSSSCGVELRLGVIEGDVQTDLDAQRVARYGVPVVQVVTNGSCHLEAQLVQNAADQLDLDGLDLLVIENVGNLVCPANFDLGEALKVVVLSTTEGDDKPLKYPAMFRNAVGAGHQQDRSAAVRPVRPRGAEAERTADQPGPRHFRDVLHQPRRAFRPGATGSSGSPRRPMRERLRVVVRGAVQGVGFRPFVYRLATDLALDGWVMNSPQGVFVEVEGQRPELESCLLHLERDRPPRAVVQSLEAVVARCGAVPRLQHSRQRRPGRASALVLPDIATCDDCLAEILDPGQPPPSLSVHELHELRPALQHHRRACPTTGRSTSMRRLRDVPRVPAPSTTIRRTAASTRSRTPARACGPQLASVGRRRTRPCDARTTRCERRRRRCGAGAHRRGEGPRRLPPAGGCARRGRGARGCARGSTARRSRSP